VDDENEDPYSAKRGFWYSHIGWMLREYHPDRYYDYANVKDLQRDPIVMWQHRHYWALAWGVNFAITGALGLIHGDLLGTLLLAGVARLTLSQHITFFINSLAHIWGRQPYSHDNSSRDNALIAFLTYGEGYHNFHHRFASDYRNGIRWWQFDPTKWAIRLLSLMGLAKNLRRFADERIERARASLQMNDAKSRFERASAEENVGILRREERTAGKQKTDHPIRGSSRTDAALRRGQSGLAPPAQALEAARGTAGTGLIVPTPSARKYPFLPPLKKAGLGNFQLSPSLGKNRHEPAVA